MNPYEISPTTLPANGGPELRTRNRWVPALGLVLMGAPLIALGMTMFSMVSAFNGLQETGSADPAALAGQISVALFWTIFALSPALVGIVLVSVALFRRLNEERWFFRNSMVFGVFYLFTLPPAGLYLLWAFLSQKHRFADRPTA
jgi:hypothetical protein